ncbi:MAG: Ig-like domain-containing protein [Spirochaetaceae bacterium]|jgi:uncharacterized protein YjdB|nr:Ig-like domain-containing protein [Spirochaetaceae bacterium]
MKKKARMKKVRMKNPAALILGMVLVLGSMVSCENWMVESLIGAKKADGKNGETGSNNDTSNVAVEKVVISPSGELGGAAGSSIPLVATIYPVNAANKGVIWTSSKPEVVGVAEVSGGLALLDFKQVSTEDVTITVKTLDGGFTDSRTVKKVVLPQEIVPVSGVSIAGAASGFAGERLSLSAVVEPPGATNKGVEWISGNTDVAYVINGLVVMVAPGIVTITARAGAESAVHTVEVKEVPVTGIELNIGSLSLDAGGSVVTLAAAVNPANATDKNIVWSSSDTAVATVSNGVVTPLIPGTATIRATSTSDSTKYASCNVTVKPVAVSVIGLDKYSLSMEAGSSTATLVATVYPANATNRTVNWASDNTDVATVSNGVVTPVGFGRTIITAMVNDSGTTYTTTCMVTVSESTSPDLSIKFRATGTGAARVADTFNKIHNYLSGLPTPLSIDLDQKIRLGDYLDLPSSFAVAAYDGSGEILSGSATGDKLRLIVVGINSFNERGRYWGAGGSNPNIAHIVMHFKDTPVDRQMETSKTNYNGYKGSQMRKYLVNTGDSGSGTFSAGLEAAGVPLSNDQIIWGTKRYVSDSGEFAIRADEITDKIWLPTEREMFGGGATYSVGGLETEGNQASLEYYNSDDRRKKPSAAGGRYWLASPCDRQYEFFCSVADTGKADANGYSDDAWGVAPAFCVK